MNTKNEKTIGFFFHRAKRNNDEVIKQLLTVANSLGFRCAVKKAYVENMDFPVFDIDNERLDFVVSLGGDGSVLDAAEIAVDHDAVLLGINNGRIGFLTEIEISDFTDTLQRMQSGDYELDKKMMLKCQAGTSEYINLNDFTVYKKAFAEVVHLTINIDGTDAGDVFCDGVVISTPTGATAYSISAGGPIIAPGLDCIIITPICPHSLCFRPIVAGADSIIKIKTHSDCLLACAGYQVAEISPESSIEISRLNKTCNFMITKPHNIYSLTREKLT